MTRREMIATGIIFTSGGAASAASTRMKNQLDCGSIGVKAGTREALGFAVKYGFEAISADSAWLAKLSAGELSEFLAEMKSKGIGWGNAGVSVEFRKGDEDFRKTLDEFPARVAALQKAGANRVTTWISPVSDSLTYMENLKIHARRLREVATVLGDHNCRMGLEYVGPKTSWMARRFPFVHTMKEMKELIAEIGKPNVGFVLDSWHWFTAGETAADLATLTNKDIVSIDLNDAPAGLALDQQKDGQREIPCATGVIPLADFLNTLNKLGCDAPARCEPFNAPLRAMPPEQALETVSAAMKKAFALIA